MCAYRSNPITLKYLRFCTLSINRQRAILNQHLYSHSIYTLVLVKLVKIAHRWENLPVRNKFSQNGLTAKGGETQFCNLCNKKNPSH